MFLRFSTFLIIFFSISVGLQAQTLEVKFISNAAVSISDGNLTVVSDFPYQSGYSIYMEYDFEKAKPKGKVLSLITHKHSDHFEPSLFEKTDWFVLAPNEIDLKIDKNKRLKMNETVEFEGVKIQPISSPHSNVEHYSYLMEWHGKSFYFTGDTESVEELKFAKDVDVLFISPWLMRKAERTETDISAKKIVVYHQAEKENVPCGKCYIFDQGESFSLSTKEKSQPIDFPVYSKTPVTKPKLFAEGIISTGNKADELFPTFSPDGKTIYFVRRVPEGNFTIYSSNLEKSSWTKPKVLPFSGKYSDQETFMSPDGKRLYFTSNRPIKSSEPIAGRDLWFAEIDEKGSWKKPIHVGEPVSRKPPPKDAENRFLGLALGPFVDMNKTLYFWTYGPENSEGASDIYRSQFTKGNYTEPENIGKAINSKNYETMPFISSLGSFMLFSGDSRPGSLGGEDIYISFFLRGKWAEPKSLGNLVNSPEYDFAPRISPDGKYLFFSSNRNVEGEGRGKQNIYFIELKTVFESF